MQGLHENISINVPKKYLGETHRACSPKVTINRALKLAPAMGITRLANITGLDTLDIPTYLSCRPNSRAISVSQGKGYTLDAAKASALMESIESYHAERITNPLILSSYREIQFSHNICDFTKLSRYKNSGLDENTRIHWIEAYDLMSETYKWVPYEPVHTDYRTPLPSGHGHFIPSSNGLSSGNHIIEATIHGICELIERDAIALWTLKSDPHQHKTKIETSTVKDKRCKTIINKFKRANTLVGIWDVTSNVGIPSFLCRIIPDQPPPLSDIRPSSGMGCHLSKDIALLRALTEAAQSRLTFISGARDDLARTGYKKFASEDVYREWEKCISDEITPPQKSFEDIETYSGESFNTDLRILLDHLKNINLEEVLVVDLTKPEFDIPVVRVLIPGLDGYFSPDESVVNQRTGQILSQYGSLQ